MILDMVAKDLETFAEQQKEIKKRFALIRDRLIAQALREGYTYQEIIKKLKDIEGA